MSIIQNKKAYHEYFIEDKYEAGIMLEGWEVKAIRAGRAQLKEAYVTVKDVRAEQIQRTVFYGDVGFLELRPSRADGLDFPAFQHDAGFIFIFDEVLVISFFILNNTHISNPISSVKRC